MSDATIHAETGIPLPFIAGIRATESCGRADVLRFEPHLFEREHPDSVRVLHPTPGAAFVTADDERRDAWARGLVPYTPGKTRAASDSKLETGREAFEHAAKIDYAAAVRCSSWGAFQVLGSPLLSLGKTPEEAVASFWAAPESMSDELLVRWLHANPKALDAAKRGDIDAFIRRYNGAHDTSRYRARFDPAYVKAGGVLP